MAGKPAGLVVKHVVRLDLLFVYLLLLLLLMLLMMMMMQL